MKQSTIAIVGAGVVGSTTAYTLMLQNLISKLILIDIDDLKCKGEVNDLEDVLSFSHTSEISIGTLQDAGQADIAIITAGIPQKTGQSRNDLLKTNYEVIKNVIEGMKPLNPNLIIIMVTNPVDILTYACQQFSKLPKNQVFGSGTLLDSQRLRDLISKKVTIAPQSIHVYVLGEHGDNQFVTWSTGSIANTPITHFKQLDQKELNTMAKAAQQKVYNIIECKGSTAFGISSCIAAYCQNILFNTKRITPVSCYLENLDICMSMPAVLGAHGIEQILIPPLNEEEKKYLATSAENMRILVKQLP